MPIRIKALNQAEFVNAAAKASVFGKFSVYVGNRYRTLYVFATNLGKENPYRESRRDDPDAQYRFFASGEIYFAETESDLYANNYLSNAPELDSIILYW